MTSKTRIALIGIGALLAGLAVFVLLTVTRERPDRRARATMAPVVTAIEAQVVSVPIQVEAMGDVTPARSVQVVPQVSGRVVEINPELMPGGMLEKGEMLFRIDSSDYRLAVTRAEAAVAQASTALEEQQGLKIAAEEEMRMVGEDLSPTAAGRRLSSRESYVENARAQLAAAKSSLDQAKLNLARTTVRAPFDARVSRKTVDVGQVLSAQSVAAELIASDVAWVEAGLPQERLQWIDIPGVTGEKGSPATITLRLGAENAITRQGRVLRLLPALQERGRLARVLIEVEHPFAKAENEENSEKNEAVLPMLVGSFVNVIIQGRSLENVIKLPRSAVREGDKVWVRDAEKRLDVRDVQTLWRDDTHAYVRGELSSGDMVVTSYLQSPVPGMKILFDGEKQDKPSAGPQAASAKGGRP